MIENGEQRMRRRLAGGEGTNEFPLLADLAAQGGTDYWTRIIPFGDRGTPEGRGLATSWTTRESAGFAEADLALTDATLPAFGLAYKATMAVDTTRTLVSTYLGRDAAERIRRGEIHRGQVKTVRKALWFAKTAIRASGAVLQQGILTGVEFAPMYFVSQRWRALQHFAGLSRSLGN